MTRLSADEYSAAFAASLDVFQAMRPRSLQREIGVSSVGHCSAEALWRLTGVDPTDAQPSRQALMGTAVHELLAQARKSYHPGLLIETELRITMPSGVVLVGHADEIDPDEPSVTDWKTKGDEADLIVQRRHGSSEQQRMQRHLYAYGAVQAGLVSPEGLVVRNVWIDRAGSDQQPLVEQEPFDMAVVHAADRWLADVAYAAKHGEDAPRDKHASWCRDFCTFYTHCRQPLAHPDLTVTDVELVRAAADVVEGRRLAKEGKALDDAGKRVLAVLQPDDPSGDVQAYVLGGVRGRWSWVNGEQRSFWKLDAREV